MILYQNQQQQNRDILQSTAFSGSKVLDQNVMYSYNDPVVMNSMDDGRDQYTMQYKVGSNNSIHFHLANENSIVKESGELSAHSQQKSLFDVKEGGRFSRKVFVGGLPQNIKKGEFKIKSILCMLFQ